MYYSIINAACLKDYFIYLKFEDGMEGVVNLEHVAGKGEAFAPLKDKDFFCRMHVDPKCRTITWPNGADLSPERLYETVKEASGKVAVYRFHNRSEM